MAPATQSTPDPVGPPAAPLSVLAVTRRHVRTGQGGRRLSCAREVLTPGAPLPGSDSRADVVVVAYHPELTAAERAAITGPPERATPSVVPGAVLGVALVAFVTPLVAGAAGWVSQAVFVAAFLAVTTVIAVVLPTWAVASARRSVVDRWTVWSADVLAAHQRVYPPDEYPAPSAEVSQPAGKMWGTDQDEFARRCWQELVCVATIPRPVTAPTLPRQATAASTTTARRGSRPPRSQGTSWARATTPP